jgi:hypothetical protein
MSGPEGRKNGVVDMPKICSIVLRLKVVSFFVLCSGVRHSFSWLQTCQIRRLDGEAYVLSLFKCFTFSPTL